MNSPLKSQELEELRWYLERYLAAPFGQYEARGQAVAGQLDAWGRALFAQVFGPAAPGQNAYQRARKHSAELLIRSVSPAFLALPWELMRDPERPTPLALDLVGISRSHAAAGAAFVPAASRPGQQSMQRTTSKLIWAPQPGPQHALITCPMPLVFFGGARGGGKTDGVLGKWACKESLYGSDFNAIMFRRTTVSSEDAIERSKQIFGKLGGSYNGSKLSWKMPNGGRVAFAYLDKISDADEWQGRNVTDAWIEEAGQYATPDPIDKLFGVLRSAAGVPVQMILTANPGGPGQHSDSRAFWASPVSTQASPPYGEGERGHHNGRRYTEPHNGQHRYVGRRPGLHRPTSVGRLQGSGQGLARRRLDRG